MRKQLVKQPIVRIRWLALTPEIKKEFLLRFVARGTVLDAELVVFDGNLDHARQLNCLEFLLPSNEVCVIPKDDPLAGEFLFESGLDFGGSWGGGGRKPADLSSSMSRNTRVPVVSGQ